MDLGLAVAPYLGAWIETLKTCTTGSIRKVAPYLGAWIETRLPGPEHLDFCGRTILGCVD